MQRVARFQKAASWPGIDAGPIKLHSAKGRPSGRLFLCARYPCQTIDADARPAEKGRDALGNLYDAVQARVNEMLS